MINLNYFNFFSSPLGIFYFFASAVVSICVFAVFLAVLIDFVEFDKRRQIKKEKRSIVATGSMFLFFFFIYYLIRFKIGYFEIENLPIKVSLIVVGLIILIFGCVINISGRLSLGKNWSNQIKIYNDHSFIFGGAYRLVRHPLYASIIWMVFAASIVFSNYLAFLFNSIFFVPFMYYRAKQEEELLVKEFKQYKEYQQKVGMFFPKIKI